MPKRKGRTSEKGKGKGALSTWFLPALSSKAHTQRRKVKGIFREPWEKPVHLSKKITGITGKMAGKVKLKTD